MVELDVSITQWINGLSGSIGFLVAAFMVMFSRVYIGIHYVSDVLGGAVIGVCAAGLVAVAFRPGTRMDRIVTGIL
jgi:undecaprenyl-diphosphatase